MKKLTLSLLFSIFFSLTICQAQEKADQARMQFEKMKGELNLTEAQATQLNSIMKERRETLQRLKGEQEAKGASLKSEEELKVMRRKKMQKKRELDDQFRAQIEGILDAEQMKKFDAMNAKRKADRKMERHEHEEGEKHDHEHEHDHKHGEAEQQTLTPG